MSLDYSETQYFRHPAIIALVGGTAIITWYATLIQGDIGPLQIFILAMVGVVIPLLFVVLRLETRVSVDGITYRMPPIVLRERTIRWSELETVDLITIRPIRDCGGWGIRYCRNKMGIAYIVSGNQMIRCTFKNGGKVLLGTKRSDEMMKTIRSYFS
ncbi:hypothetical protein [Methanocalculus sp.]|uniref:hypothetical protein n=1 Tax=Methanocalculus sp. TaxID=2004547 RepID=UPI00272C442D|nr:hypothetical protein [Methanocalculus sp.]